MLNYKQNQEFTIHTCDSMERVQPAINKNIFKVISSIIILLMVFFFLHGYSDSRTVTNAQLGHIVTSIHLKCRDLDRCYFKLYRTFGVVETENIKRSDYKKAIRLINAITNEDR